MDPRRKGRWRRPTAEPLRRRGGPRPRRQGHRARWWTLGSVRCRRGLPNHQPGLTYVVTAGGERRPSPAKLPSQAESVETVSVSNLEGRVAVVTGTSSGLGAQAAKALDAAGARVVLASRRHETDLALAEALHDALAVRCDVREPEDRATLVGAAIEQHGRIDILVNNAGVAFSGPAEEEDIERFRSLVDTNLIAVLALSQLVAPHMFAQGGGAIVNIASPSA